MAHGHTERLSNLYGAADLGADHLIYSVRHGCLIDALLHEDLQLHRKFLAEPVLRRSSRETHFRRFTELRASCVCVVSLRALLSGGRRQHARLVSRLGERLQPRAARSGARAVGAAALEARRMLAPAAPHSVRATPTRTLGP
eukprot:6173515-Pleurochrysis_carterae.AAC.2